MSGLEGLLAGHTLSERYRIEEVIGRGGFAAVYRARDERLGRTVALKVITLGAGDPETRDTIRRRFAREATVAASLHHVNVVTVFDVGTDPRLDLDFLVMELLHGEDLARRLSRGEPFVPRAAVRLLRDAAWGLAAGHRSGLIHRDVKPANIFLAEQESTDRFRVCILDFGIAQIRSSEHSLTRLTRGGAPLSPPYAAPEQLREERDLSPAADVYGLGVIGYQLFTGERPYGPDEIQGMIRGEPPPPPRFEGLALPPGLEATIRRALAPNPERRFADAGELAGELDAAYDALRVDGRAAEPAVPSAPVAAPVAGRTREAAPPAGPAPARAPIPEPIASRVSRMEGRRPPPPPEAAAQSPSVVPPKLEVRSAAADAPAATPPPPAAGAPPRAPSPPQTRAAGEVSPARGREAPGSGRRAPAARRLAIPLVLLLAALGGWWALSRGRTAEPRLAGDPGARPGSSSPSATGATGSAPTQPGAQPTGTSPAGTQAAGAGGTAPAPGTVAGPGTGVPAGTPAVPAGAPSAGGTTVPAGAAPVGGVPSAVPGTRPGTAPAAGRAPSPAGGTPPAAGTTRPSAPATPRPAARPASQPQAPAEEPRRTPSLVARGSAAEYNRAAERLFDRRNYAGAVAGFRRAVAAAPGNSYYRNNLGWALYMAGDLEGAERELRATVRMDPRRAIAYANLGEVHWARGDAEGAVANYRRFLELNTDPRRERIATEKLRRMGATP